MIENAQQYHAAKRLLYLWWARREDIDRNYRLEMKKASDEYNRLQDEIDAYQGDKDV